MPPTGAGAFHGMPGAEELEVCEGGPPLGGKMNARYGVRAEGQNPGRGAERALG